MARPEKEAAVAELAENFTKAKSMVITDYLGLDVEEMTELRSQLREAGVDEYIVGPTAIAFGLEDVVSPAKILVDFAEDHEDLEIKAGTLNGGLISKEKVESLADIPPREQLLAQVFSGMQAPISGLVNVLQGNVRGLVQVLNQIKEQKQ